MSVNYVLYLADQRAAAQLVDEVAGALVALGAALGERAANPSSCTLPHLWVAASKVRPPVDDYVREEHGFVPSLAITLRLDKEHLGPSQDELLQVVAEVLQRSTGDAVLLREAESPALRRRAGKVEVLPDALWADARRRQQAGKLAS